MPGYFGHPLQCHAQSSCLGYFDLFHWKIRVNLVSTEEEGVQEDMGENDEGELYYECFKLDSEKNFQGE